MLTNVNNRTEMLKLSHSLVGYPFQRSMSGSWTGFFSTLLVVLNWRSNVLLLPRISHRWLQRNHTPLYRSLPEPAWCTCLLLVVEWTDKLKDTTAGVGLKREMLCSLIMWTTFMSSYFTFRPAGNSFWLLFLASVCTTCRRRTSINQPISVNHFLNHDCAALRCSCVSRWSLSSAAFLECPEKKVHPCDLVSSLLFCGLGGIARHIEQHCAQLQHHAQRTGSAEQVVLQGRGARPGVDRRARRRWRTQPPHALTVPQLMSPAASGSSRAAVAF